MKTSNPLIVAAILTAAAISSFGATAHRVVVATAADSNKDEAVSAKAAINEAQRRVLIRAIEQGPGHEAATHEVAWLGLGTEETSEALAAQLGLHAGQGLVVTFVSPDSPAAKAGLQRNDVLVELEGQELVLPAQLRKLVQMRKEGEAVKVVFYRRGQKEDMNVTLGKTTLDADPLSGDQAWPELRDLRHSLENLRIDGLKQTKSLQEALAKAGVNRENVQVEIQRSLEKARSAYQQAMRGITNAHRSVNSTVKVLEDINRSGVPAEDETTVTLNKRDHKVKTVVKTDESGSYVVVADPKKRLTAHDKDGKLLFDGEIETLEQQEKVPSEVWEKVKPLVQEVDAEK